MNKGRWLVILTLGCDSGVGTFTATCLQKNKNQSFHDILETKLRLYRRWILQNDYWHISHLFDPFVRNQVFMQVRWAFARPPRHWHPRSIRTSSLSCWHTLKSNIKKRKKSCPQLSGRKYNRIKIEKVELWWVIGLVEHILANIDQPLTTFNSSGNPKNILK